MVDFIVDNYLLILIITVFLIFALIGYLIDSTKNRKKREDEILTQKDEIIIDEVENTPIIENVSIEPVEEVKEDNLMIPDVEDK